MSNHTPQKLSDLLAKWQKYAPASPPPPAAPGRDVLIHNFVEHTADVQPGSCFVARVRTGSDGHPYIPQAIERGASLIIGQKPAAELPFELPETVVYWSVPDTAEVLAWLAAAWHNFPSQHLTMVGVTGTDGKTSTATLIYEILRMAGLKTGMITTIKAVLGETEEPTGLHVTTPAAPEVQSYLQRMVEAGLTHCVLETTSHGLEQHRVTAVEFTVAVVTNITHEHLDYHGNYENYFRAKQKLFEMVLQTAQTRPGKTPAPAFVLNRDDNSFAQLSALPLAHQISYGIDFPAHVWADNLHFAPQATHFTAHWAGQTQVFNSSLVGKFNVYNMLAAIAAGQALGLAPEVIKRGIEAVKAVSGRMERLDEGQPFLTIVDFAHTPNALDKALTAGRLMTQTNGRVIAVFGSAGKRDIEKRRLMAEISAQKADITVLTAEDPRTERLEDILEMMAAGCRRFGGVEGGNFWRVPDRGEAIYLALSLARPGDVVLVCGKGHEQSMNFDGVEYPWDDRHATRTALQAFLSGRGMPNLGLPTFQKLL